MRRFQKNNAAIPTNSEIIEIIGHRQELVRNASILIRNGKMVWIESQPQAVPNRLLGAIILENGDVA